MSRLRGNDLSELYPKPKTFDERQAERAERLARRVPKFVPIKISLWATLTIPTVLTAYYLIRRIMLGGTGSTTGTLSSVSFSILTGLIGLAVLWYLFSLIGDLAYRATTAATLLYGLLATILFINAGIFAALSYYGQSEILAISVSTGACFLATYLTVSLTLRLDT